MPSATSFPTKRQLAHMLELKTSDQLYDGDHAELFGIKDYFKDETAKERKLYLTVNMPALITDFFADMQIGDGIVIDSSNEEQQKAIVDIAERNELDELAYDLAQDQSKYGYGVVRVRAQDDKAVIEDLDPSEYFPEYDNRDVRNMNPMKVTIASWIKDPYGKYKHDLIYKTIYERTRAPEEDQDTISVRYELRVAKIDRTEDKNLKDNPNYTKLYPELLEAPEVLEWTDRIPVWEIANLKSRKNRKGKSDYKDVVGLIQEINDRFTHISIQLIKHLNAKIAIAAGGLSDEEGDEAVTRTHEVDFIEVGEGEITPQYVESKNPLIDMAMKFIDKLSVQALSITKVPPEILHIEGVSGGNMKVEAMKIRQYPTIRKIERKQKTMRSVLVSVLETCMALEGSEGELQPINLDFVDAMPEDKTMQVNQMVERKMAGLISTKSAIERLDDLTPDEAQAEIDRIQAEQPEIEPFEDILT